MNKKLSPIVVAMLTVAGNANAEQAIGNTSDIKNSPSTTTISDSTNIVDLDLAGATINLDTPLDENLLAAGDVKCTFYSNSGGEIKCTFYSSTEEVASNTIKTSNINGFSNV